VITGQPPTTRSPHMLLVRWLLNTDAGTLEGFNVTPPGSVFSSPIKLEGRPVAAIIDNSGVSAYYVDQQAGTIDQISFVSRRLGYARKLGKDPSVMAASSDGGLIYVGDAADGNIYVFRPLDAKVIYHAAIGASISDIVVSSDNSLVYATDASTGSLYVFDPIGRRLVQQVQLGKSLTQVLIDPVTQRVAYVLDSTGPSLVAVNLTVYKALGRIPMPSGTAQAALDPSGAYVYARASGSAAMYRVNLANGTTTVAYSFPAPITSLTSLPDGNLLVACEDGTVTYYSTSAGSPLATAHLGIGTWVSAPYPGR
jgi:DNA-binding beta-propeller fold protein YncE